MNEYLRTYITISAAFLFGMATGINLIAFDASLPDNKHIHTIKDIAELVIFSLIWPVLVFFMILSVAFGPIKKNDNPK